MLTQLWRVILACILVVTLAACGGGVDTSNPGSKKFLAEAIVFDGVATFAGNRGNYTITPTVTGYTVIDNFNGGQITNVSNVSVLKFADISINLGIATKAESLSAADLKTLTELYVAFFNRVPDADGLAYWIDQFKSGQSIDQISDNFYRAAIQFPELTGYSASMSNADFVRIIYKNVLGRTGTLAPPDADVQYWSNDLAKGDATKGKLIRSMLVAAHSFDKDPVWSWVTQLLDNKVSVAIYYAVQQGVTYNTPEQSIAKTMAIAALVTPSTTAAALNSIALIISTPKPTTADCANTPSLAGCAVILPSFAQCVSNPALSGCATVLPTVARCVASPSLQGCSVVLPTFSACTSAPTLPGCIVILPSIGQCQSTPALLGCASVIPTTTQCAAQPSLAGCAVASAAIDACKANPSLASCITGTTVPSTTTTPPTTTVPPTTTMPPATTVPPATPVPPTNTVPPPSTVPPVASIPPTQKEASRFLSQATFGPTLTDINQLVASGYNAWIDAQTAKPRTSHRAYVDSIAATLPAGTTVSANQVYESFWKQAITGDDQLRQRVTFALSEIFVVSLQDSEVANYPRGVAGFYDTLADNAFGNYRTLLEQVSLHPMMGTYLTSLHNQKASGTRVPDENYAREVMQLMSIGLLELNPDGSARMGGGKPLETYTNDDITGMAKVFTGWSWAGADKSDSRFNGGSADPNRDWMPMQSYPKFHATVEKKFLGVTIAAQGTANPEASLKVALDTLFNHPNVGPFIGKQLIQRLVTSNPSPQYIARVSAAFANNGNGVRGDMKAVVKAILTDPDARSDATVGATTTGKLREPVVRLANWMRAFNATSASGRFLMSGTDDPLSSLGQTAMRAPSVFNFFRPGYTPPNTTLAAAGLVSPEMQLTGETSIVGYLNFMMDAVNNGTGSSRDIKPDYTAELALADKPDQLVDRVNLLLMSNQMPAALRTQILGAINSVAIPATNTTNIAAARKNRVLLAVFLTMASPDYLVQK